MTERPAEFEGVIRIEWRAATDALPGWMFRVFADDGRQIFTVTRLTIHAVADQLTWAECVMFADSDGKPVYGGGSSTQIYLDDDKNILTGTFPFEVASMSVAEPTS